MDNLGKTKKKRISKKKLIEVMAAKQWGNISFWETMYAKHDERIVFAAVLRSWRRGNFLSKAAAAGKLGVNVISLSRWEAAKTRLKPSTKEKLVESGYLHPAHLGGCASDDARGGRGVVIPT